VRHVWQERSFPCALKFKFKYIDGIVTPTTPSLFVGKCCHRALDTFYRHRMLGVTLEAGDVVRRFEASWGQTVEDQGMKRASPAEEQALRSQVAGLSAVLTSPSGATETIASMTSGTYTTSAFAGDPLAGAWTRSCSPSLHLHQFVLRLSAHGVGVGEGSLPSGCAGAGVVWQTMKSTTFLGSG